MHHLDLTPHVGIGPIKLGAQRIAVRAALAGSRIPFDSERGSMDFFADAAIQVEYEEDGTASFIGVSSGTDVSLLYEGVDLFDTEAKDVFALCSRRDASGEHQYSEYEFIFPSQVITLYDADPQYDHRKNESRAVWGQIGLGDQRYLRAILQLNGGVLNPEREGKE